jgi:hypothetical protein
MLLQHEVARYLLERRLVGPRAVVRGDLLVTDASRRNRNFKVVRRHGRSYLLKQGAEPDGTETLAREAAAYRLLHRYGGSAGLAPYLPRCYGLDAKGGVLAVELAPDGLNLREFVTRRGRFPVSAATALGDALGRLHRVPVPQGLARRLVGGTPLRVPWVLSLHRPLVGSLRKISGANLQLVRILQSTPGFGPLLDDLRRGWRPQTLIHQDVKPENVVVLPASRTTRRHGLWLVDWELAGVGDPCWDAGSVFGAVLGIWLLTLPFPGAGPLERTLALAPHSLEGLQPAIRAFWRAYCRRMGLGGGTAGEWLLRAARYGAARLVQTAFEHMQGASELTGNVLYLLQLSLNVLQRPHDACAVLLGLPPGGGEVG